MADFFDSASRLSIGDLSVHPDQRRVTRGEEELHLSKLTYDLLLALAERAPALVTQDELAERVWPGRVASTETIQQRVKILRESLGDDASDPRYIRVVRGTGYQLIPSVERIETTALPTGRTPRWDLRAKAILAGVASLAVAVIGLIITRYGSHDPVATSDRPRIAVLPCEDLSPDPSNAYFAAGMHEELVNRLGQLQSLFVLPRASTIRYSGPSARPSIPEIARELDASAVVECTVRYAGSQIMLTARLVDAASGNQLFSAPFPGDLSDLRTVFALQADIATRVADALNLELTPVVRKRLEEPPTQSPEAYAIYLDVLAQFDVGRNVERLDFESMLQRNIDLLGRAIELDPDFAEAYVTRGAQHAVRVEIARHGRPYYDAGRELELAASDFERALAIDASLGAAHSGLASIALLKGDTDGARDGFERALRLRPNDPSVLSAVASYYLGESRRSEALALLRRIIEIDPNIAATSPTFDGLLIAAGDLDTAAEFNRRFADANPASIEARLSLGYIEAFRGDRERALAELDLGMNLVAQNPGALVPLPEWLAGLTYAYGRLEEHAEAQRLFDWFVEALPDERHVNPIQWVRAYLGIDDIDRAYEWAQMLAAEPLPPGHSHELHFMLNSHNDPRLERPEFLELRRKLGYSD